MIPIDGSLAIFLLISSIRLNLKMNFTSTQALFHQMNFIENLSNYGVFIMPNSALILISKIILPTKEIITFTSSAEIMLLNHPISMAYFISHNYIHLFLKPHYSASKPSNLFYLSYFRKTITPQLIIGSQMFLRLTSLILK
jgi:hypothetical protein